MFTEFSNNPIGGDDKYDYENLNELAEICEKKSDNNGILNTDEDREFCRTLVKNLMIVTKDKLPCQKEKKDLPDMWDCIPKCDLLNTWLIYVKMTCKREELIKHVFEKVNNMKEKVKYKDVFEKCEYGQIKPGWRGDKAMMMELYKFLMKEDGRSKIMDIHNQNWCGGRGIKSRSKTRERSESEADNEEEDGNEDEKYKEFTREVEKIVASIPEEQPTKVPEIPKKVIPEEKKPTSEDTGPNHEETDRLDGVTSTVTTTITNATLSFPEKNDDKLLQHILKTMQGVRILLRLSLLIMSKQREMVILLLLVKVVLKDMVMLLLVVEEVYFGMLRKTRKRYRRAHQIRGPSLEEQIVDHVDDQGGPREYYIVKERKPRSTPMKRKKKGVPGRRRRMIIDIHLEVLDECQKGDLHSTKEDFFKILVQEFMGSNFMKEEKVKSSESGFREEDFIPKEQVPSSDSGFREGRLCS
ncbi:SICA antigen [Plasmodium coatneyi]|uniref:SICA antigen n=1 Tax=Plasmodium coatneyi TaxID=208452 RepID=A0A1B1E5G6_9APIC|nr:SICA antigen [Plasmodium coatneyi]ANQ10248.1 SICA antigen [Plasmodium coatneyi]